MVTKKPQLTISLLASDRPDTIRRCLDSLRSITDAISCELILIDTSKNAEVHNILLEYTDQVYEFEWCKDFAKARNEGLSRAKGEWFLYLDDDEWFVETEAIIEFFKSGEYRQYGYANYQVRNFMDVKYTNYSDCWVSRMVRVDEDTRFVSKIHEYFAPLRGARKDLYALAYHSGYIYETPEKKRAHFERNCSLLLDMIKEEPENIRWQTQLVQEYTSMGEWEMLTAYCKERLTAWADIEGEFENIHIGTFYAGYVYGLLYQNRYEECIQVCHQALADVRSSDVLKAMMHLKLGEACFRIENYDEAIRQVNTYFQILENTDVNHPEIRKQTIALVAGEAFDDNKQKNAYSIWICSKLEQGDISALLQYYDKLGWNQSVIYILDDVELYLANAMKTMDYHPIFVRIIMDAFPNRELGILFSRAILSWQIQNPNNFQIVLYTFVEAMQEILMGPKFLDLQSYYAALQNYVTCTLRWYDFVCNQNENYSKEVPEYVQAAAKISEYFQIESQDTVHALGKLKEAVDIYPEFANGIGRFMHSYAELEKQRAKKQQEEMQKLREQVIEQIKGMAASGQYQAALQILGQLKQMFPEDLEIIALGLELRLQSLE